MVILSGVSGMKLFEIQLFKIFLIKTGVATGPKTFLATPLTFPRSLRGIYNIFFTQQSNIVTLVHRYMLTKGNILEVHIYIYVYILTAYTPLFSLWQPKQIYI